MLCTSGFTDDVMFSYHGTYVCATQMSRQRTGSAAFGPIHF